MRFACRRQMPCFGRSNVARSRRFNWKLAHLVVGFLALQLSSVEGRPDLREPLSPGDPNTPELYQCLLGARHIAEEKPSLAAVREYRYCLRNYPDSAMSVYSNLGVTFLRMSLDPGASRASQGNYILDAVLAAMVSFVFEPLGRTENIQSILYRAGSTARHHDCFALVRVLSAALPIPPSRADPQRLVAALGGSLPAGKPPRGSFASSAFVQAAEAVHQRDYSYAIDLLCSTDGVVLAVTEDHRASGALDPVTFAKAALLFRVCGVVLFDSALSNGVLKELAFEQRLQFADFLRSVEKFPEKVNSSLSAQRSPGRMEVKFHPSPELLEDRFPADDSGDLTSAVDSLLNNRVLAPFMQVVLGDTDMEVDTFSSVTSLGHTASQHWHSDVSSLKRGMETHLTPPPQGLVAFVPMRDVPLEMGPTMFLAGSHLDCPLSHFVEVQVQDWLLMECNITGRVIHTPAKAGSYAIFDVRTLHRGGENKTPKKRPYMYLAYFQQWFVDRVNFYEPHTGRFDQLTTPVKRLLARIDARNYVYELETALRNLGVDPASIGHDLFESLYGDDDDSSSEFPEDW